MDEARKRTWDTVLGVVAPLLTIGGILVGVWQFNVGERNRTNLEYRLIKEKDTVEFKRKLWLERLSAYKTIADLAGQIAAYPKRNHKLDELLQKFESSYWGLMILVEDRTVEQEMISFHLAVEDYRKGWTTSEKVKKHADRLVQTCKQSLSAGSFE